MEREFGRIAMEIAEMVTKKNKMYGNSYFALRDKYGPVAFVIRLSDKLNRIESLTKTGEIYFESYEDSVKDIAGYALLELAYLQQQKDIHQSIKDEDTTRLFKALIAEGYPFEEMIESMMAQLTPKKTNRAE